MYRFRPATIAATLARQSRGPVLLPPCHLHRRFPLRAQAQQRPRPPDNRAPQRTQGPVPTYLSRGEWPLGQPVAKNPIPCQPTVDVSSAEAPARGARKRGGSKAQGKAMGRPPSLTPAQQKDATRRRAPGATLQELADSYA
jgi:hypothetical protein